MTVHDSGTRRPGRRTLALAVAATLAALLLGPSISLAQEPSPTPTAGAASTVLRVEAPPGPIADGEQFDVQLVIENVEHLAGFDAFIDYDHEQLRLVSGQMEPFFIDGEREPQCVDSPNGWVELSGSVSQIDTELNTIQGVIIQAPDEGEGAVTAWFPASETDKALEVGKVERTRVFINCFSSGPPVSLDGPAGVSGSDALATMTFEAIGDGTAELQLTDTQLLLDDVDPPGSQEGQIVNIPHDPQSASVELEGSGGGSSVWVIIGIAAVVAVALAVVGGAVLLRRGGGSPPSGSDSQLQA